MSHWVRVSLWKLIYGANHISSEYEDIEGQWKHHATCFMWLKCHQSCDCIAQNAANLCIVVMLAYKFVTGGHPVWILTGTQVILVEVNCGLLQPLQSNSRMLPQLGQDSALPNPFRFVMQKPPYSNTILTAKYRMYAWFPKKLVCTVAVLSDCHAIVRQRKTSCLAVSAEAFMQAVKLFFREWWAALLKIQWFAWTN